MKIIARICSILLGITFLFSGFAKGIDPLGSKYKFTDYFVAFGWDVLVPAAFFLGILLAFAEFAIGVALFFSIRIKWISWISLAFILFFTGLTLHIAQTNPVTDCGCFGDALKLTNWQTFYKNIFLLFLTIPIVFQRHLLKPFLKGKHLFLSLFLPAAIYIASSIYSCQHLPLFDFRPFKAGINIPKAMVIPPDAPQDKYRYFFTYRNKKTGKEKIFTDDNYPWQDTLNWEYVSSGEPKLISKGYEPPIHDFFIESPEGEDVSDYFLTENKLTILFVAYDLKQTSLKHSYKINALANFILENNLNFIGLTASPSIDIIKFTQNTNAPFEFFFCDEITLKTVIRSNPGLVLVKNGTILAKWHHNDTPTVKKFQEKWMK